MLRRCRLCGTRPLCPAPLREDTVGLSLLSIFIVPSDHLFSRLYCSRRQVIVHDIHSTVSVSLIPRSSFARHGLTEPWDSHPSTLCLRIYLSALYFSVHTGFSGLAHCATLRTFCVPSLFHRYLFLFRFCSPFSFSSAISCSSRLPVFSLARLCLALAFSPRRPGACLQPLPLSSNVARSISPHPTYSLPTLQCSNGCFSCLRLLLYEPLRIECLSRYQYDIS